MRRPARYWAPTEDQKLREAWEKRGESCIGDIAASSGRETGAVRIRARRIGLLTTPKKRTRWSDEEVAIFYDEWSSALPVNINAERIAAKLGRTVDGVLGKARLVGLVGGNEVDPYAPHPSQSVNHATACLREGGFPAACIREGKAVWLWPTRDQGEGIAA